MLKKIRIKNFKNIENETFDLTGNVLISGENGSGKSSLLQALRYCLTDSLTEKLSDYIRWGESGFEIGLDLDFENVNYSYEVSYKEKGGGKKSLTWNDQELKGQDASKKLKEILSSDLLLYSSISEQGQSYSILLDSPTERLETFKSILGIDKIGEVVEKMKEDLKEYKTNADLIKKEKETLESKKFEFMDEFELPNITQIKSDLQEQELEKEKKEKNDRLRQEYEILLSEYKKKLSRKEELESLIESIQTKINSFHRVEYKESEYLKLKEESWIQQASITSYNHDLSSFESYEKTKDSLNSKFQKLENEKEQIQLTKVPEITFTQEDISIDENTLNDLKLKLKEVENHLNLVLQGRCPTCGQNFQSWTLKDLVLERNELQKEVSNFEISITDKKHLFQKVNKINYENKILESKLKSLNEQIVNVNHELNDLQEVLEPVKPQIDNSIGVRLQELEKTKIQFEEYEKNISSLNKRLLEHETELKGINLIEQPVKPNLTRSSYDENEHKRLQKEVNIFEQKVEELDRIKNHNKKIENDKKENENLIKEKDLIYYNIQEDIRVLDNSKTLLDKQYSTYIIEKGTKFVEKQMNVFFQKCYPKYEVFFRQASNKKSIEFFYTNGSDSERVYSASLCSGFEKQLLAMAFRVALASITKVGFLILDEIDSDASENNSISLYSNLIESKLFNQLICITHKEETKSVLMNNYNARLIEMVSSKKVNESFFEE